MRTAFSFQFFMAVKLGDCPPQGSGVDQPWMATNSRPLASAPRSCTRVPLPSTNVLPLTLMARPVEGEEPPVVLVPEPLRVTVELAGVPTAAPVDALEIETVKVFAP